MTYRYRYIVDRNQPSKNPHDGNGRPWYRHLQVLRRAMGLQRELLEATEGETWAMRYVRD